MTTNHIHPSRKVSRAMGASRDFTTGTPTGATGVLERDRTTGRPRAGAPRVERTAAPRRPDWPATAPRPEHTDTPTRSSRRLGSRQVVSVRGRQVAPTKRKAGTLARVSVVSLVLLISGVAVAMWLSGIATQQTFRIQQLSAQESELSNQLETLHRDLENVSSSAEVARRASEMGMIVPQQPGILGAGTAGQVDELRPAGSGATPIIDVNGAPVRPDPASSDPDETDELADSLASVAENPAPAPTPVPTPAEESMVAPYRAGGNSAPVAPAAPEQTGESGL